MLTIQILLRGTHTAISNQLVLLDFTEGTGGWTLPARTDSFGRATFFTRPGKAVVYFNGEAIFTGWLLGSLILYLNDEACWPPAVPYWLKRQRARTQVQGLPTPAIAGVEALKEQAKWLPCFGSKTIKTDRA